MSRPHVSESEHPTPRLSRRDRVWVALTVPAVVAYLALFAHLLNLGGFR